MRGPPKHSGYTLYTFAMASLLTWVSLARVPAPLGVPGTQHGVGDHGLRVHWGAHTLRVTQHWHVHSLSRGLLAWSVKYCVAWSYLEHIGGGAAGVKCAPASDGGQGPCIGGGGPGQTDRAKLGRGGEVDRDREAHQSHVIVRGETEMNRLQV